MEDVFFSQEALLNPPLDGIGDTVVRRFGGMREGEMLSGNQRGCRDEGGGLRGVGISFRTIAVRGDCCAVTQI